MKGFKHLKQFLFVLFLGLLLSCSDKAKEAVEFNDKITDLQRTIDNKEQALLNALYEKNDSAINVVYSDYIETVDSSVSSLHKMEDFDENYKQSMLDLFKVYKSVGENEYRELIKLIRNDTITNTDNSAQDTLNKINEKLNKEFEKVKAEQKKFAHKYNIEVQN